MLALEKEIAGSPVENTIGDGLRPVVVIAGSCAARVRDLNYLKMLVCSKKFLQRREF